MSTKISKDSLATARWLISAAKKVITAHGYGLTPYDKARLALYAYIMRKLGDNGEETKAFAFEIVSKLERLNNADFADAVDDMMQYVIYSYIVHREGYGDEYIRRAVNYLPTYHFYFGIVVDGHVFYPYKTGFTLGLISATMEKLAPEIYSTLNQKLIELKRLRDMSAKVFLSKFYFGRALDQLVSGNMEALESMKTEEVALLAEHILTDSTLTVAEKITALPLAENPWPHVSRIASQLRQERFFATSEMVDVLLAVSFLTTLYGL